MPIEIVPMPKAGEMMVEGVVVEWLIEEGDRVVVNQPIAVVETDKVELDVESPWAGTIVRRHADVDDRLSVGDPLCEIETVE